MPGADTQVPACEREWQGAGRQGRAGAGEWLCRRAAPRGLHACELQGWEWGGMRVHGAG